MSKSTSSGLWQLIEGERWRFGLAVFSLTIASCLFYLVPLVTQVVLDGALADGEPPSGIVKVGLQIFGGQENLRNNLWLAGIAIALLTGLAGVFTYHRSVLAAQATEGLVNHLRNRIYHHIQHLPCAFFDTRETGDLLQRCTSDVETLRVFLGSQVVEIGRAMIMLLIPVPLMIYIHVQMAIASIVLLPLIVIFSWIYFSRVRSAFQQKDEAEGAMTARIQENLTGIRVVKAFHRQDYEQQRMDRCNTIHRDLDYRLYALGARFWAASDLLCFLQSAIVVIYGAILMSKGDLLPGAFFFFISAVNMFIWPVRMMGRLLSELGKALVAARRISEILGETEEPQGGRSPVSPLQGKVEFEAVSFSHGNENPVLDEVSFAVEPGTTLAILGPSGSGKSTLVDLLLRFYEAEAGEIRLDGIPIKELNLKEMRSEIAVVMQEPFLFTRSLKENIAIANREVAEESIHHVANMAALHDTVSDFEKGYETIVGERGITLSGGQRQRVAIARALLKDPAVLVLDDALSAVDTDTEEQILAALRSRRGRRTTILIAHRLSTLKEADEILVLEQGKIRQRGSHEELVIEEGLYRRLWQGQEVEKKKG